MLLLPTLLALAIAQSDRGDSASGGGAWQQSVAYEITAALDESKGVLGGTERIVYRNRSPDTLHTFSLHLHLNAFRPGSRWSAADSVEGRRRFNDLKDPDFGFNHVTDVRIMGEAATALYPYAPDSTIVRFALPQALPPGDSMVVELGWDARPSTTPRRQARRGRHYDFAHWYPKVVVYDREGWEEHALYPAGEFYGEFGSFLVDLDLPEDQVVGATGVAVCGDPGWERANRDPSRPVQYDRDHYGNAGDPAMLARCRRPVATGRKRLIWYAEDVHHFVLSVNPDFRYEGGHFGPVAIHVLYQPGDEPTWGGGIVVQRTAIALAWLDQLFGPFAWPQLTNLHRIDRGSTEAPMVIQDGSPSQGLIVHEAGHNYVMGQLANNEWKEGWLDEGFTEFQTDWFWETNGRPGGYEGTEPQILMLDLDGYSEPTSLVSDKYRDFATSNLMIYNRGKLFFHQLRHLVGDDAMRRILRTYFSRYQLRHVDEAAFRETVEEVSGQDLDIFFAQWLHSTVLYDYAVGRVRTEARPGGGGWTTRVEVVRKAPGMIPVEVAVRSAVDTTVVRADGLAQRDWVEVTTRGKPKEVVLDPGARTHDWNLLDNRKLLGFHPFKPARKTENYLDPVFSVRARRDRLAVAWLPTAWYNDAGGVVLGIRSRENYLGRFEQNQAWIGGSTGWGTGEDPRRHWHYLLRIRNPVWLRSPRLSETFEFLALEGRIGALVTLDKAALNHLGFGPTASAGVSLRWLETNDPAYLDPRLYDDGGTGELETHVDWRERSGAWNLALHGSVAGGVAYSRRGPGLTTLDRFDTQLYGRGSLEGTARRPLGGGFGLSLRAFAGVAEARDPLLKQRQVFLAGADPYEQLYHPFLRSRGAPLVGSDFNYHSPGGAGVRGLDPHLSGSQAYALGMELDRQLFRRPKGGMFGRVSLAGFGDLALANGDVGGGASGSSLRTVGDAGLGVRAEHRIGDSRLVTRFDLPLYVSRPSLAQDQGPGSQHFGFRWSFSFEPAF